MFALAILACLVSFTRGARGDDDLEAYRERFRTGYEKYKSRDFSGAIVEWESIYRELGPKRGYRLAFNLGRAYDAYGDATRAAEKFESYIEEVATRRAASESLEAIVEKQEAEARARLSELATTRGRIKVTAKRTVAVQIDSGESRVSGFTAYVSAGDHTVTFDPGTSDAKTVNVTVSEGALEEVVAPEPPPVVVEQTPKSNVEIKPLKPTEQLYTRSLERPFSPWIMYGSGAATVVSIVVPSILYANATPIYNRFNNDPQGSSAKQQDQTAYNNAKNTAYLSWILPSALATITGGITAYYFFGKREVLVPVTPQLGATANSATLGISGAF